MLYRNHANSYEAYMVLWSKCEWFSFEWRNQIIICWVLRFFHFHFQRKCKNLKWTDTFLTWNMCDKFEMILFRGSLQNHSIFCHNNNWSNKFLSIPMTTNKFDVHSRKFVTKKLPHFLLIHFAESKEIGCIFFFYHFCLLLIRNFWPPTHSINSQNSNEIFRSDFLSI